MLFMRRPVLITLFVFTLSSVAQSDRPERGRVRWDAWTGGGPTEEVQRTLAPPQYRFRLPWFAKVGVDGTVQIDGNHQNVMDQEIDFAADAHIDYWAFLIYAKNSSMSRSLELYLASETADDGSISVSFSPTR